MWEKLKAHRAATENTKIATLFEAPQRAEDFSARFDNLLFDYSKTQIDTAGLDLLLQLADDQQVAECRQQHSPEELESLLRLQVALRRHHADHERRRIG